MDTNYKDYNDYLNQHNAKNLYLVIAGICLFIYALMHYIMSQNAESFIFFINHNNDDLNFNLIGMFLSNYSHINLIHLSMNLFFGHMIVKRISLFLIMTKKEFLLFHTLGAFFMGFLLFIAINYVPIIKETTQAHLGYSSILFGLYGILLYTSQNLEEKAFNILFIILIYFLIETLFISTESINISHLGHFIGFFTGILFCVITNKKLLL